MTSGFIVCFLTRGLEINGHLHDFRLFPTTVDAQRARRPPGIPAHPAASPDPTHLAAADRMPRLLAVPRPRPRGVIHPALRDAQSPFEAPSPGLSSWAPADHPPVDTCSTGPVDSHEFVPADILALAAADWGKIGPKAAVKAGGLAARPAGATTARRGWRDPDDLTGAILR